MNEYYNIIFRRGLERLKLFTIIGDSFTESILCSISEPAILYDSKIRVAWVNTAAEMYFKHSCEFLVGKNCYELFGCSLECRENCPLEASLATDKTGTLTVDGVFCPEKLIEAIPYTNKIGTFILALVHSIPEIDRNKALRRDFAAELNLLSEFSTAAAYIVKAMENITSVPACGVYIKERKGYNLVCGKDVPELISEFSLNSPQYLPENRLPFSLDIPFPEGAAIVPVVSPGGITEAILLAGSASISSTARTRLEMIASVTASCIERFIP